MNYWSEPTVDFYFLRTPKIVRKIHRFKLIDRLITTLCYTTFLLSSNSRNCEKIHHFKLDRDFWGHTRRSVYATSTTAITNTDINNNIWAYINVYNPPSMFQPLAASTTCLMSLSCKSNLVSKILVELQLKLHRRAFVKFVIRLCRSETNIGRCWARMRGQGSSSVIWGLLERSIDDNDDKLEDSSKTFGSMNAIRLLNRDSEISWCRLVNTSSCSQQNSLLL